MASTECVRCNEPILPVTIAGVTSWLHDGRKPDAWEAQYCIGIQPLVRAMPKNQEES